MAKKLKPIDLNENRRLLNRWVFELAYRLMEDENASRSAALRQAHLVKDLLEALGRGEVVFQYEKSDGTLRTARGTLCKGVSEAYDTYEYKTEQKDRDEDATKFSYWDLDKECFRSFAAMRIEGFEKKETTTKTTWKEETTTKTT